MDLVQELLLTVLVAAVLSFIVTKLLSVATAASGGASQLREIARAEIVVSAQRREIESERRVQVSEGDVEKVDKFFGYNELLEEVESDLVGRTDCDLAVGNALDRVSEEKIVKLLTVDDEIVKDIGSDDDSAEISGVVGENTGNIGVEDDIREIFESSDHVIGRGKLDEFDDVDEKNALAGVSDKKIVEDTGGNHVSFENSGAIGMNNEAMRVESDIMKVLSSDPVMVDHLDKENASKEKFAEHLLLDDKNVKDIGYFDYSFNQTEAMGMNIENFGDEGGIRQTLVTCRERNLDEIDDVGVVSEVKVVEHVLPVNDTFGISGVNDEIVKSIKTEGDIILDLGSNDLVLNEVVVQEEIQGRECEKFVEQEGVDNDNSRNSGAIFECGENVWDIGDIMVYLGSCGDDVVAQDFEIKDEIGVNQSSRIEYENNEAKVDNAIISNLRTNEDNNLECAIEDVDEKMKGFIDDDWEGIERNELEESFAAAANYVLCADKNISKFDSDVKMELYGLNKVALEGPCREPQPMAIKVSARAKWNAWQKLGSMSPEVAMEQYISLLSDKAPEWKEGKSSVDLQQRLFRSN